LICDTVRPDGGLVAIDAAKQFEVAMRRRCAPKRFFGEFSHSV
jgi:hypothetical protein